MKRIRRFAYLFLYFVLLCQSSVKGPVLTFLNSTIVTADGHCESTCEASHLEAIEIFESEELAPIFDTDILVHFVTIQPTRSGQLDFDVRLLKPLGDFSKLPFEPPTPELG